MGFFSAVKKWFGGGSSDDEKSRKKDAAPEEAAEIQDAPAADDSAVTDAAAAAQGEAAAQDVPPAAPEEAPVESAPAESAPEVAASAVDVVEAPAQKAEVVEAPAVATPSASAEESVPAATPETPAPEVTQPVIEEDRAADATGAVPSVQPEEAVERPSPADEKGAAPAEAPADTPETEQGTEEAPAEEVPVVAAPPVTPVEAAQDTAEEAAPPAAESSSGEPPLADTFGLDAEEAASLTLRLREAEPRLSAWLAIILDGVEEAGDVLWQRLTFLLRALEAPQEETQAFVDDFRQWADRMDYRYVADFRSELQYRLALALDMEDEEDERSRLFLKISQGLARTREQFSRGLDALFSSHGELNEAFWEELEELFIMADLGYETALELVQRLRERARKAGVTRAESVRELLMAELAEIFQTTRRITAVNPPEVVLFIGVNGVGKTTTIAKLAHRARMQGKKVMIAAADTFRAAAIEQLQVWAERVGALFHSRPAGSDPASVAYEAMDRALAEKVDILFVDTAGRLQTKTNLMEELSKIRMVLGKKHAGAPHRTVLVIDATTGQNALSQAKLFKEAAGVDELILTKLDGTAKGGVAIAVAMQEHLPITFVGLGEKLEDLRPFSGEDYARALLGQSEPVGGRKA